MWLPMAKIKKRIWAAPKISRPIRPAMTSPASALNMFQSQYRLFKAEKIELWERSQGRMRGGLPYELSRLGFGGEE